MAWTRGFFVALRPHLSGGVYVNDLSDLRDEGERRVREVYGGNCPRLAKIKREYDPDNVFRANQNIKQARQRY